MQKTRSRHFCLLWHAILGNSLARVHAHYCKFVFLSFTSFTEEYKPLIFNAIKVKDF